MGSLCIYLYAGFLFFVCAVRAFSGSTLLCLRRGRRHLLHAARHVRQVLVEITSIIVARPGYCRPVCSIWTTPPTAGTRALDSLSQQQHWAVITTTELLYVLDKTARVTHSFPAWRYWAAQFFRHLSIHSYFTSCLLVRLFIITRTGWESQCLGWFRLSAASSFRNSCSSCGISFWASIRCFCYRCWPPASSACAVKTCTASCRTTRPRPSFRICPPSKWFLFYRWHSPSRPDKITRIKKKKRKKNCVIVSSFKFLVLLFVPCRNAE